MIRTTLTLTQEQLRHTHACLAEIKRQCTADGAVWHAHQLNANIRTAIERSLRSLSGEHIMTTDRPTDQPGETFEVCDRCTTSIENDDWTWIDASGRTPEESLEYHATLLSSVEAMGNAVRDSRQAPNRLDNGYFRCFVCGDDTLGFNYYTTEGTTQ